jgi:pimeloyl-ACP methyl ester carboxylesterase
MPDATVAGRRIHYEIAGDGLPLVLLHGIGSNSRSWRRQLEALSKDFKVIAWDAPGYDGSDDPPTEVKASMRYYADQLRGMLDSLGLKRIFLLGHSTGGAVALEFCRVYPQYLDRLIVADARYAGSTSVLDERLRLIRTLSPAELAQQRAPKLLSANASAELVNEVISTMSQVRRPGYEFAASALACSDAKDVIHNFPVPTMLIWGADDQITPVWDVLPPRVELKIIPNAGHLCYIEQPEHFNELVRSFLSKS